MTMQGYYYPQTEQQTRVQPLQDLSLQRQRSHLSIGPPQPSPLPQYTPDHLRNTHQQQQQLHAEMAAAVASARRSFQEQTEYLQQYAAIYHHPRQYYPIDRDNQDSVALSQPLPTPHHFHQRHHQPPMSALGHQHPLSPLDPRYLEQMQQQTRFLAERPMPTTPVPSMIKFDSHALHNTPPLLLD
jgi:hypothetical protein